MSNLLPFKREPNSNGPPSRVTRRLAAIAFADIAGFSKLMAIDDVGTLSAWQALRNDVLYPYMEAHRGRLADTAGDSVLIEFQSAVGALSWALDVQRRMQSEDHAAEAQPPIALRIGINIDDVILDEGTIQSEGVNIASRIHQAAKPGQIVVTSTVRDLVLNRLPVSFQDLGRPPLKNIDRPVHVFSAEMSDASHRGHVEQPYLVWSSRPTLAVLPFRTIGGGKANQYFGEGMTEDIITGLSRSRSIFVIAHASTLHFRDKNPDLQAIAKTLGVTYIVNGSIRRQAKTLRINAELIDMQSNRSVWAERYDGDTADLFDFQDRITSSIITSLTSQVRAAEVARIGNRPTGSLDAYDCLLKATSRLYRFTPQSYKDTEELLNRAVRLDPNYAQAHAYLAWRLIFWIGEGHSTDPAGDVDRAMTESGLALSLDPDDPFALAVRGHCMAFLQKNPGEALDVLEQAIQIDENLALGWALSSVCHAYLGRGDEARERLRNVWRLTPYDPLNFFFWVIAGIGEFVAGRYEEAVAWMKKSNRANPTLVATLRMLAAAQALNGDEDEAKATAKNLLELEPGFRVSEFTGWYPLKREEDLLKLSKGLISAGLPD